MTYPTTGTLLKACWNTFGRVMKISEGPLSGFTPTEKAAGKIISPARIATTESIMPIWTAEPVRFVDFEK